MDSDQSLNPGSRKISLVRKAEIDRLAAILRLSLKIFGSILVLVFARLQFKDIPVTLILENAQPLVLLKLVLTAYYFSWVFGLSFDINTQQIVYVYDPNKGRMTWSSIGAISLLMLVAGLLFWASGSEQHFAGVLNIFVVSNIFLWLLLLKRIRMIIRASKEVYLNESEFFELERLSVVESYIAGSWQRHRFVALCILMLAMDVVCFNSVLRQQLSTSGQFLLPDLSSAVIASLLPNASLIIFISIAEGWIWIERAKTRASLHVIDRLRAKYILRPASS
jgi:hypothetical protein